MPLHPFALHCAFFCSFRADRINVTEVEGCRRAGICVFDINQAPMCRNWSRILLRKTYVAKGLTGKALCHIFSNWCSFLLTIGEKVRLCHLHNNKKNRFRRGLLSFFEYHIGKTRRINSGITFRCRRRSRCRFRSW